MTIFEKIIAGEIPSYKVYEDDEFIAFLDIQPKNTGHTLVVPKKVKTNVLEEDQATVAKLFTLCQELSNKLMKGLDAQGIKWQSNINEVAGQEVFHTHIHLIPYYGRDVEVTVGEEIIKKLG